MGIRDYRIAGMAIFDWVATMIAAYGIVRFYGVRPHNAITAWIAVFVILVLLSIQHVMQHKLFRVDSVLANYLLPPVQNWLRHANISYIAATAAITAVTYISCMDKWSPRNLCTNIQSSYQEWAISMIWVHQSVNASTAAATYCLCRSVCMTRLCKTPNMQSPYTKLYCLVFLKMEERHQSYWMTSAHISKSKFQMDLAHMGLEPF